MKKNGEIKKKKEDEYQHYVSEAIGEIDEMVNNGMMDQYEAARLKDQIMSGRNNCLA